MTLWVKKKGSVLKHHLATPTNVRSTNQIESCWLVRGSLRSTSWFSARSSARPHAPTSRARRVLFGHKLAEQLIDPESARRLKRLQLSGLQPHFSRVSSHIKRSQPPEPSYQKGVFLQQPVPLQVCLLFPNSGVFISNFVLLA